MTEQFASERELVDVLVSRLPELFDESCSLIQAREVPNAARVIDVVALYGADDPTTLLCDWSEPLSRLKGLDRAHLSLLALIWSERRISLRRLAELTWTAPDTLIRDYLSRLEGSGLVEANARATYTPTGWGSWRPGRIAAVEAKLYDWKGCLRQAVDNALWADVSYAAFPSGGPLANARVRAALRAESIGGAEVSTTCARLVVRPRPSTVASRRRRAEFALGVLRDLLHGSRWTACA